jgi:hypothetical protein
LQIGEHAPGDVAQRNGEVEGRRIILLKPVGVSLQVGNRAPGRETRLIEKVKLDPGV